MSGISRVFTWLCVVFAWLPRGLKIHDRYFMCFKVPLCGICMASIGSEDSWAEFHMFSFGSASYLHGFQEVRRFLISISYVLRCLYAVFAWLPLGLKIPEQSFTCFHVALRAICMASKESEGSWAVCQVLCIWLGVVFPKLPICLNIPGCILCVFIWLCVVFAWLPMDLKPPELYFTCFQVAIRGICMVSNKSEDSWTVFDIFSRGSA